jgi:hypothetical protein
MREPDSEIGWRSTGGMGKAFRARSAADRTSRVAAMCPPMFECPPTAQAVPLRALRASPTFVTKGGTTTPRPTADGTAFAQIG